MYVPPTFAEKRLLMGGLQALLAFILLSAKSGFRLNVDKSLSIRELPLIIAVTIFASFNLIFLLFDLSKDLSTFLGTYPIDVFGSLLKGKDMVWKI